MRLDIKPLSVNNAWQGKRFKTPLYKTYEEEVLWMLPQINIPEGKMHIKLTFGLRANADIDNPIKCFLDILQKKYEFDDKDIWKLEVEKAKGSFIEFEILPL